MNRNPADLILTLEAACRFRESLRREGKQLVVTNGCFDILHRGHAEYLHEARALGDAMIVLINSDASVRALKGPERPIIDQYNRAYMLAALESVDGVVIFDGARCDRELAALAADRYVKGGDALHHLQPLSALRKDDHQRRNRRSGLSPPLFDRRCFDGTAS